MVQDAATDDAATDHNDAVLVFISDPYPVMTGDGHLRCSAGERSTRARGLNPVQSPWTVNGSLSWSCPRCSTALMSSAIATPRRVRP